MIIIYTKCEGGRYRKMEEGNHEKNLIQLLEGLEIENIPELLQNGSGDHFRRIGEEITKMAKIGARIMNRRGKKI